ncbi:MAG: CBS domain-containing protein [Dehalococcoidia bacterium]
MTGSTKLGEFFGIPVRVHNTWFIASALIVLTLAVTLRGLYPWWQNLILGIVASLLFFGSMCARALAQYAVATNRHMPVRSVTLYVFGGFPRITEQDTRPAPEILMAITGPLVNLVIAGLFYAVFYILSSLGGFQFAELIQWLFYFNIMIALFNFSPAFPLDAGWILRAILQLTMKDYSRATRTAALTGQIIGFVLIATGGLAVILARDWFAGVATVVFGLFLEDAATMSHRQALIRDALRGMTAQDMMSDDYTPIKQQLTFALVREYIINSGQHCFVVVEDGKLRGIVTLGDTQISPKLWESTRISDIMTPAGLLETAPPDQPAVDLLEQMDDYDIDQMPVTQDDKLVGMVTRERLRRFLKARAVLRA